MDKPNDLIHLYDGPMDDLPAFLRPDREGKLTAIKDDEQQPALQEEPEIHTQVCIIGIGDAGARMIELLQLGRLSSLAKFVVLDKEDEQLTWFVAGADLVIIIASLNETADGLAQTAAKISKEAGALTLMFSADLLGDMPDTQTISTTHMEPFECVDTSVIYSQNAPEKSRDGTSWQINPISFHAVANLVTAVNVRGVICVDYFDIKAFFDQGHHVRFAHVLVGAGADPAKRLEQLLESGQLSRDMAVAKRIFVAMSASVVQCPSLELISRVVNVVRRHCRDDAHMIFSMNEVADCSPGAYSVGIYTIEN